MHPDVVDAVLTIVDRIPAGKVLTYGDIAVLLEYGGPRQVGTVMSRHGSAVPWWRVVRAGGLPPACHEGRALEHYRRERMPLRGATRGPDASWRVDMAAARWTPTAAELDAIDAVAAALARALSEPRDQMEA